MLKSQFRVNITLKWYYKGWQLLISNIKFGSTSRELLMTNFTSKYYNRLFKSLVSVIVSISFLGLPPLTALAQDSIKAIDINSIRNYRLISEVKMAFAEKNLDVLNNYEKISFSNGFINRGYVLPANVKSKALLKFRVFNDQDTLSDVIFFPGFFFRDVRLYKIETGVLVPLPSVAPDFKDSIAYRIISVPPFDTLDLLAEIIQVKTYNNRVRPRLINTAYISSYISELHNSNTEEALFTYIFCGLLIMMVLFSFANFYQGGNREFLFYGLYALFLGFMLFTKPYYYGRSYHKTFFYESYLDFILQGAGICFYMVFMMLFLNVKKKYPFLHKFYLCGIIGLATALVAYTYWHYGTDNFYIENLIENYITKGALLIMIIIFLVYAWRHWGDKLLRYLFWGNLFFLLFSIASLGTIVLPKVFSFPSVFRSALVLYETGLLLELFFFLAGLTYKNRRQIIDKTREGERLKIENERKEMEKQLAVMAAHQEERDRISADMHDELGSGMTTIRLMSEIAKNKMKENTRTEIEKISSSANDLLNKMNAIIWSMNSGNDKLDNLISYIRVYTLEYLEGTPIHCSIRIPDLIPDVVITGDKRRNIFLCIKETLNNALKHSKASEMKVEIEVNDDLVIRISDNGTGIDKEKIRMFGNGLKNIARRMENIGGSFKIEINHGTVTTLNLPIR